MDFSLQYVQLIAQFIDRTKGYDMYIEPKVSPLSSKQGIRLHHCWIPPTYPKALFSFWPHTEIGPPKKIIWGGGGWKWQKWQKINNQVTEIARSSPPSANFRTIRACQMSFPLYKPEQGMRKGGVIEDVEL